MRTREILRSVMINIIQNKARVFLTTLGIIVGCATIIMVIGIGNQSKKDVEDRFSSINAQTVTVMSDRGSDQKPSESDLDFLTKYSSLAAGMTISNSSSASLSYDTESVDASVNGVYENFFSINNLEIESGALLSAEEIAEMSKSAVIGNDIASELFSFGSPVGSRILINGQKYTVSGVLKRTGNSSRDLCAYIPYAVLKYYVGGPSASTQITALSPSIDDVVELQTEIEGLLTMKYETNPFRIRDVGSILEAATESAGTIALLLASIGVIVLIVGGIGIMNVLFVSVKERTREIGILKALGATKRDILLSFLFESLIISFIGGLIGVLASIALIPLLEVFDINLLLTPGAFITALGFSLIAGTVFGYYPALQASGLKTIDALRYE